MIYNANIKYPSIIQYTIYGERHSGTNFLEHIMSSSLDIPLTWDYGWKHWFGFVDHKKIIRSPRTLFICIIRNPYDWLGGFFLNPYHVPKRNQTSIQRFLTNEWYSIDHNGNEILLDRNYFNHKRYQNILELRKYKLYYLRYILPNLCDNYVLIRYEDLIKNPHEIIQNLSTVFSIQISLQPISLINKYPYHFKQDIFKIINDHLDWDLENKIGYFASDLYSYV